MKGNGLKILLLIVIIIISSVLYLFQNKVEKPDDYQETNEITKQEEILEEDISILIPTIKEKCEIEECITNNTITSIFDYLDDNNYEKIDKTSSIYYRNASILIKLVLSESNNQEIKKAQNKDDFTYIFNKYTTLDDLKKILNNQNINYFTGESATDIAVLNYHFFYDKKTEKCNQTICLDIKKFEEQLKYLKENNFKTLTIDEFKSWMYKEIDLPKKSVLITVDDGAMGTSKINGNKLIPLLEKYEINATLFLITGWWEKTNYESSYLDIQSHSNLMHEEGICSNKERGAKLLCSSYDEKISDLKKSIEKLNSNTAFCFPFYAYDQESIKALKELDFKLAFIGGNKKTNHNIDKYKIPRYIIYKTTSLKNFKNMVN